MISKYFWQILVNETMKKLEGRKNGGKELIKGNFEKLQQEKDLHLTKLNQEKEIHMEKIKLEMEMLKQNEKDKQREHEQKILEVEC